MSADALATLGATASAGMSIDTQNLEYSITGNTYPPHNQPPESHEYQDCFLQAWLFHGLLVGWLVGNRGKTVVHCIKHWRTAAPVMYFQ